MEKKQYELCLEVLRRFYKSGLLKEFILIGSWCLYFYQDYFSKVPYPDHLSIKTRDLDFLIDEPAHIKSKVNVPELLEDLGFVTDFKGIKGYIRLDHPDLILEFLVEEKGKGRDTPYPLPKLSINATALRFLNFLSENVITVKVEDMALRLPHPANFALHKLIISQRRSREDKAVKDKSSAVGVLRALLLKGDALIVQRVFRSVPSRWQKKILSALNESREKDIIEVLKP